MAKHIYIYQLINIPSSPTQWICWWILLRAMAEDAIALRFLSFTCFVLLHVRKKEHHTLGSQQRSLCPAKAPTSSSFTAMPSESPLICKVFFFTRGTLFGLDSLGTACLRLLGTFFWGSQALSSLSSSSEADDLGVNWQKNSKEKWSQMLKAKKRYMFLGKRIR